MTERVENRPWTRWWWMGGALTEREITIAMERFRDVGLGGVEVSPIYGVRGGEERYVSFLSEEWVALFAHALREAKRLGMGVDLIAGTGWPFGGPWVSAADSAKQIWVDVVAQGGEAKSKRKADARMLAELVKGNRRYALFLASTEQQVKRAAPGGAGNVLDHFDAGAVRRYLAAFDQALAGLPEGLRPRCFFNDSWEVFGANATADILDEFKNRRGYDLGLYLAELAGEGDADTVRRVRSDYRETIHELTLHSFLKTFGDWAREGQEAKMRNQAHGSPGNLLDLYAAADIPETEVFGPARLALGGLESYRSLPPDFGTEEEALVSRMASSAAHVAGRQFCSSESFTWLGEHGHVTLEQMKAEVDTLFTLGINHIFFHGTPFSPEDAPWPGWLFYATTHCAPTNTIWRDLPTLNRYIAECQKVLQSGEPDNGILLYFPFYDLMEGEEGTHDLLQFLTVGRTANWLRGNLPEFTEAANLLTKRGWAFDLVSDRQLSENIVVTPEGLLSATGQSCYHVLLITGCDRMPPETLERITELAHSGATVLVAGEMPTDVPGLSDMAERRGRFQTAKESLHAASSCRVGADIETLLSDAGVRREELVDQGLEFIRRQQAGGVSYFISNPGTQDVFGWVPLAAHFETAVARDPMNPDTTGALPVRMGTEVYLSIPAGASLLLDTAGSNKEAWQYFAPISEPILLEEGWQVEFIEGGAILPATRSVPTLSDWTTWHDEDRDTLQGFSGTARYTLTFDAPIDTVADAWELELGKVYHSASVSLNGTILGAMIARPWNVEFPAHLLKPTGNVLTIEVTNLMANRMATLEREKGDTWRPFLMVNIHYKPFDAAKWEPVPSGLVGPVRLVPLKAVSPEELE